MPIELNDNERLAITLALQAQIVSAQMLLQRLNPQTPAQPEDVKPSQ
jgi:hypothetical protein